MFVKRYRLSQFVQFGARGRPWEGFQLCFSIDSMSLMRTATFNSCCTLQMQALQPNDIGSSSLVSLDQILLEGAYPVFLFSQFMEPLSCSFSSVISYQFLSFIEYMRNRLPSTSLILKHDGAKTRRQRNTNTLSNFPRPQRQSRVDNWYRPSRCAQLLHLGQRCCHSSHT